MMCFLFRKHIDTGSSWLVQHPLHNLPCEIDLFYGIHETHVKCFRILAFALFMDTWLCIYFPSLIPQLM